MGVELLDKTRKINQLLHNNSEEKIVFNDFCLVLEQVLDSSVYVVSKKGKLLGVSRAENCSELGENFSGEVGNYIDPAVNERLILVLSTKENVNLATLGFDEKLISGHIGIIVPVYISGERYGTLFMYRKGNPYDIDDIILAEYGATVVSLQMLNSVTEEVQEESRKNKVAQLAISSLSSSELEAVTKILNRINSTEGTRIVASAIADELGITRSIIVNALRKLESAGVIEAKSQGMKGTYLRVLNDSVFEQLEKLSRV